MKYFLNINTKNTLHIYICTHNCIIFIALKAPFEFVKKNVNGRQLKVLWVRKKLISELKYISNFTDICFTVNWPLN